MKSKKKKPKISFKYIFLFLVGVLICSSLYIYIRSNESVNYERLKLVSTTDEKINIKVPEKMTEVQRGITTIDYEHRLSDQNQSLISHIRVESQYFGNDVLQSTKNEIIKQLKQKEGEYYEIFKNKTNTNPAAKDLSFNGFTDYKLGERDGIISDFTYKYDNSVVVGRLLLLFGEDTIYFTIIESTEKAWQDNLNVWQEIIGSLRIN